jgi:LL-diaminopimelate aminotransferase
MNRKYIPANRIATLMPHFFTTLSARIASLQSEGQDVIRLDEGSPDLPPATHIVQALVESINRPDVHGYQAHRGPFELRQAWAAMYKRLYNVDLNPDNEIVPLIGSKEGIYQLMQALVNPGDVVLVPDPGYITYSRGALIAGGEPVSIPLKPENGYLPDLASIPVTVAGKAKMLWLNYPNNPTTGVATLEFFASAVDFARQNHILLCHDAAYSQITFDGQPAPSIMQIPGAKDVAVEFNTLSKSHNMAGWRVGAAIGNSEALSSLFTLKTNSDSGHFYPIMHAAAVAMTGDQNWLLERNQIYRARRDLAVALLNQAGLGAITPKASIYVWCSIPDRWSSAEFVSMLLDQQKVSLTPGSFFGHNGEGYIRISLTAPIERSEEAMQRIRAFMEGG